MFSGRREAEVLNEVDGVWNENDENGLKRNYTCI